MNKQARLARKNLDKKLAAIRAVRPAMPPRGWTRAIREALGMTVRQLAQRMKMAPSRISAIEKAEGTGSITIKSLREAAEALDCEFIYAFVPRQSLDDALRAQVGRKIDARLRWLNHSMRLENQAVNPGDLDDERRRLIDEALAGSLRGIWDE
jgi:predicted DNA-binding mobile mystery protein A